MPDESPSRRPGGIDNRQILTVVAAVLLTWFAISNWQSVEIHFWVTSAKASLFVVILVSALLGGVVVRLAARRHRPRRRSKD